MLYSSWKEINSGNFKTEQFFISFGLQQGNFWGMQEELSIIHWLQPT